VALAEGGRGRRRVHVDAVQARRPKRFSGGGGGADTMRPSAGSQRYRGGPTDRSARHAALGRAASNPVSSGGSQERGVRTRQRRSRRRLSGLCGCRRARAFAPDTYRSVGRWRDVLRSRANRDLSPARRVKREGRRRAASYTSRHWALPDGGRAPVSGPCGARFEGTAVSAKSRAGGGNLPSRPRCLRRNVPGNDASLCVRESDFSRGARPTREGDRTLHRKASRTVRFNDVRRRTQRSAERSELRVKLRFAKCPDYPNARVGRHSSAIRSFHSRENARARTGPTALSSAKWR